MPLSDRPTPEQIEAEDTARALRYLGIKAATFVGIPMLTAAIAAAVVLTRV